VTSQPARQRVLSGMRPTGQLHLGNYHGALRNWVALQHDYPCFFFVADWHALTTGYDDTSQLPAHTQAMVIDWLAAGLNPAKATLFVQSQVPEHAELHLLLSMITPLSWLERVPTYKDQQAALQEKDLATYGFLGYPLLQSADILLYRAGFVPVGEDQVAHIEITREIARRFNHLFGRNAAVDILPEPQALLTPTPKLPGVDGRKMSKSYANTIGLRESPDSVDKKLRTMQTDPARVRRADAGDPAKCPVWSLHEVYSDEATRNWAAAGCRSAGIGCLECKRPLIDKVVAETTVMRERAAAYEQDPASVRSIIEEGNEKARVVARETLGAVRQAMHLRGV